MMLAVKNDDDLNRLLNPDLRKHFSMLWFVPYQLLQNIP